MKKILIILPILLFAVILVSGCTSYSGNNSIPPPPSPGGNNTPPTPPVNVVNIKDFAFNPQTITIKKGSSVTWLNQDSAPHDIRSEGNFDSGTFNHEETYTHSFNDTGTFDYICAIHTYMKGKVIVEE